MNELVLHYPAFYAEGDAGFNMYLRSAAAGQWCSWLDRSVYEWVRQNLPSKSSFELTYQYTVDSESECVARS